MIRTLGRQRLKSMGREIQKPVRGDRDPIQQLECRPVLAVRPGETPANHVNLLQLRSIDEASELSHGSPVKTIIVFVLGTVDHVEVPA
jgi:hypothetical protein